jgi:Flp pilus assembly protein TadD
LRRKGKLREEPALQSIQYSGAATGDSDFPLADRLTRWPNDTAMLPHLTPAISGAAALAMALASIVTAVRADEAQVDRLLAAGERTQALAHLDELLADRPRDPQLRLRKGVVLADLGRSADAMATFEALVSDHPEIPEVHNNMAVLHAAEGRLELARSALDAALRANPNYALAHHNLGDVYAQLARRSYQRALDLDPSNAALPPKLASLPEAVKPAPPRPLP